MPYRTDREQFIARMATEGLPHHVTLLLLREATGIHRRAELACSSKAADRDRVPCPAGTNSTITRSRAKGPCLCDGDHEDGPHAVTRIAVQDWRAEERIYKALAGVNRETLKHSDTPQQLAGMTDDETRIAGGWTFTTEGDPRGYTLKVIPPSYAARNVGRDRFNRKSIGVPAGPSGLRW